MSRHQSADLLQGVERGLRNLRPTRLMALSRYAINAVIPINGVNRVNGVMDTARAAGRQNGGCLIRLPTPPVYVPLPAQTAAGSGPASRRASRCNGLGARAASGLPLP